MHKLIVLAFACVAAFCPGSPVFACSMEAGDAEAVQRAAPAVVSISTWKVKTSDQPSASPQRQRIKTFGSGFIVDPSGIIVTNKHVIDGAFDIKALLEDGSVESAYVLATSSLIDLAVLKVDVGHPRGTSVSSGIVSGLNRNLMDSPLDSYIQTDAAINHGNSGGPLVDRDGKVVGIDTALFNPTDNGGFIGIGFAIPASTAQYVTKQILDPNHAAPGWLGFNLQDLTGQLAVALGVSRPAGAIISSVDPSGPASQASLKPGDVLVRLDGQQVADFAYGHTYHRRDGAWTAGTPDHQAFGQGTGGQRDRRGLAEPNAAWRRDDRTGGRDDDGDGTPYRREARRHHRGRPKAVRIKSSADRRADYRGRTRLRGEWTRRCGRRCHHGGAGHARCGTRRGVERCQGGTRATPALPGRARPEQGRRTMAPNFHQSLS